MDDQKKAIRGVRIIRVCMLVALVVYFVLPTRLLATNPTASLRAIEIVVGIVSLVCVNSVFFFNRKYVRKADEVMLRQPSDADALKRWRTGYIGIYSISFAVALYGTVLHFFGAPALHVIPFFLVGGLMILWFRPKTERKTTDRA